MKNNLKRLQMMILIFGNNSFYNCEATNHSAICFGKYSPELLLKALRYKFKMSVSPNGFIWLTREKCSITLTD